MLQLLCVSLSMTGGRYLLFRLVLQVIHPFGQQPLFPGQLAGMLLLEGYRPVDVWSKGQTDGIGHQHLPELSVKVFVGQDEGVFLELVGHLAHFAGDLDVGSGVNKLLTSFSSFLFRSSSTSCGSSSRIVVALLYVCLYVCVFFTIIVIFAPAGMKDEKAVCVGTQTARLRLGAPGATQTVRTCRKLGYRLFVSVLRVE